MSLAKSKTLILLGGRSCSGKDFLAECFLKEYPFINSKIFALALELKKSFSKMHNVSLDKLLDRVAREEYRSGIIHHAENVIKPIFGLSVWAKVVCRKIEQCLNQNDVFIVTDCRFAEEMVYFHSFINSLVVDKKINIRYFPIKVTSPFDQPNCGYCLSDIHKDFPFFYTAFINRTEDSTFQHLKNIFELSQDVSFLNRMSLSYSEWFKNFSSLIIDNKQNLTYDTAKKYGIEI